MKMAKKSITDRARARLLRAAENFCVEDNEVQEARRLWRELKNHHDPYNGICLLDARQRSQCCKYCIDFLDNAPDYQYALYKRRAEKTNMKRAFKDLMDARATDK